MDPRLVQINQTATPPSKPALAMALTSSIKPWLENMRLMPDIGFRRLKFGANALVLNNQPRNSSGEATVARTTIPRNGSRASAASKNWTDN